MRFCSAHQDIMESAILTLVLRELTTDNEKLMRHGYVNGTSATPKEFKAWKTNDKKKTM